MPTRTKESLGAIVVGAALIAAGVLVPMALTALFSRDGEIESATIRLALATLRVGLVGAGLYLLWSRPRLRIRDLVLPLLPLAILLLLLEAGLRIASGAREADAELESALGWVTTENVRRVRDQPGFGTIRYSAVEHGFRRWGDPSTPRLKVLFIGDSFTKAVEVSDGETYYDRMAEWDPEIEVFAYGGSGYGSLQEYLVLDRFIDLVRPDLIVWQFCTNDLINNLVELESASLPNNSQMVRPYYRDGRIEYLYPSDFPILRHSRLAQLIRSRLQILRAERLGAETVESSLHPSHPLVRRSVDVTVEVLRMARERAGPVPIVAFSVNRDEWAGDAFAEISRRSGVRYVAGIPEAVEAARAAGVKVDGAPYDLHWNRNGHAIAARVLLDSLVSSGALHGPVTLRP